jgi:hypothetical protein
MSEQQEVVIRDKLEEPGKIVKEVTVRLQPTEAKRPFAGFKMDLAVATEGLVLRVPVRYAKMDSKEVAKRLKIVHRVGNVEVLNKPSPYNA